MKNYLHKSLSIVLVLTIVLSLFVGLSFQSSALSSSGKCGENVAYTYSSGNLVISGSGAMYNYGQTDNFSPFYYQLNINSIVINGDVTSIGDFALCECYNVTSVRINNSVKTIGNGAFSWCHKLETVNIPSSVTNIGIGAFFVCEKLANIDIPNSVTSIGIQAFSGCSSLTSITIPDSVTSIGEKTFEYCNCLTEVVIPSSITSIGKDAFINCNGLKKVVIDDVSAWCNISFEDSTANPLYYANNLYLNETLITSLIIPDSVVTIGAYTFYKCSSLTSLTVPNTVTSIGWYAFGGCNNLSEIHIHDLAAWCKINFNLTNPLVYAHNLYLNDTLITDLVIPDSVINIGAYAFYSCSNLTSASIPSSVKSIGYSAFGGCIKLNSIEIMGDACSVTNNESTIPANTTIINHGSKSVYDYAVKYNRNYICNHVEKMGYSKEPTCIETGQTAEIRCSACGILLKSYEIIDALGHNYQSVVTAPTCTEKGFTTYTCTRCGDSYIENEIAPLGHTSATAVKEYEVAATCTKAGSFDEVVYCSVCKDELSREHKVVAALGHDETTDKAVAPTCTQAGLTQGSHCSRCGEVFVAQDTIPAFGHDWTNWSVVTAPEGCKNGLSIRICNTCNAIENLVIPASGTHTPAIAVKENEKAPTCIVEGSYEEVVKCSVCGEELSRTAKMVSALGHTYKTVTTKPTGTTLGYSTHTCSLCGASFNNSYTAPTGKLTLKHSARTVNAIKVQWNNVKTATGYQVQISTKDGKKWDKYYNLKAGVTSYTFKCLAAGNAYKFRVRFFIKAADGKNYYSPWSATLTSPTLPTGTTLTKLTPAKKAFTAQWKKNAAVTGYQVQYSLKSNFSGAKTITVKSPKTLKAVAKKLNAGKYYYVRIRTYKTISKVNYFSAWSKTYKVKTK